MKDQLTRLEKLEKDFLRLEDELNELAIVIKNTRHEIRIIKNYKNIDVDHPSNKFF